MHKAHTRIFVKKILKKMLFLDIDHAGIGGMLSQKICLFRHIICVVSKNCFTRFQFSFIILGMQPKFTNKISHNLKGSV